MFFLCLFPKAPAKGSVKNGCQLQLSNNSNNNNHHHQPSRCRDAGGATATTHQKIVITIIIKV